MVGLVPRDCTQLISIAVPSGESLPRWRRVLVTTSRRWQRCTPTEDVAATVPRPRTSERNSMVRSDPGTAPSRIRPCRCWGISLSQRSTRSFTESGTDSVACDGFLPAHRVASSSRPVRFGMGRVSRRSPSKGRPVVASLSIERRFAALLTGRCVTLNWWPNRSRIHRGERAHRSTPSLLRLPRNCATASGSIGPAGRPTSERNHRRGRRPARRRCCGRPSCRPLRPSDDEGSRSPVRTCSVNAPRRDCFAPAWWSQRWTGRPLNIQSATHSNSAATRP